MIAEAMSALGVERAVFVVHSWAGRWDCGLRSIIRSACLVW